MNRLRVAVLVIVLGLLFAMSIILTDRSARGVTNDMVVLGDSISATSFYVSKGGEAEDIWWRLLANRTGLTPRAYAEPGSGYGKKGDCNAYGTTISQRLDWDNVRSQINQARSVIIAAGVNDFRKCGPDGHEPISDEELATAVNSALNKVDGLVWENSRVILTVPYGTATYLQPYRDRIVGLIWRGARDRGFQYVDTSTSALPADRTFDGIHPNKAGNAALSYLIYNRSSLNEKFPVSSFRKRR